MSGDLRHDGCHKMLVPLNSTNVQVQPYRDGRNHEIYKFNSCKSSVTTDAGLLLGSNLYVGSQFSGVTEN